MWSLLEEPIRVGQPVIPGVLSKRLYGYLREDAPAMKSQLFARTPASAARARPDSEQPRGLAGREHAHGRPQHQRQRPPGALMIIIDSLVDACPLEREPK
jgi:hypothetical protein